MQITFVALAAATTLALGGCGASTEPVKPEDFVDSHARIVAVTVLDSTTGNGFVPMTIHWLPQNCSERIERVIVGHEPGYQTMVTVETKLLTDVRCPQSGEDCISQSYTFDVPLFDRLVLTGYGGAVVLNVANTVPPVSAGQHAVQVLQRSSLLPVSGVVVEHRSEVGSGNLLSTTTTDSTGWAIALPGCPGNADGSTILMVTDPLWGCGFDALRFDAVMAPCRGKLRTYLLYGTMPPLPDVRTVIAF